MDKNQQFTKTTDHDEINTHVVQSDATPVHAEPIGAPAPPPAVEPDRKLSTLAWAVAAVLFLFNRKIGLVFFVILLVFRQYPTFSLKSLPGKIGSLYRKNRS